VMPPQCGDGDAQSWPGCGEGGEGVSNDSRGTTGWFLLRGSPRRSTNEGGWRATNDDVEHYEGEDFGMRLSGAEA
jgi:hypothetical protein